MLQRMLLLLNHDSRHDENGQAEGAAWIIASGRRVCCMRVRLPEIRRIADHIICECWVLMGERAGEIRLSNESQEAGLILEWDLVRDNLGVFTDQDFEEESRGIDCVRM